MVVDRDLVRLIRAAGADQAAVAAQLLAASPDLALDRVEKDEEFFLAECHAQLYAGDSALHPAAFSYSRDLAHQLAGLGADVLARNRRGAAGDHPNARLRLDCRRSAAARAASPWPHREGEFLAELLSATAAVGARARAPGWVAQALGLGSLT
jgi:hypothetical protein